MLGLEDGALFTSVAAERSLYALLRRDECRASPRQAAEIRLAVSPRLENPLCFSYRRTRSRIAAEAIEKYLDDNAW